MKRYDEYKDSGIQWLGEIPSHWKITKIKREFEFSVGGTPSSGNQGYYTENEVEGYKWVNISDINNKIIDDTKSYVTLEGIKNTSMSLVPKGSLLFSFKLSVGQVAFIADNMYTNEAIASFSKKDNKNNLNYLYYASPIFIVKNSNENIYGAKILNQELIKNAYIVLPPLNEQCKIANYLDRKTSQIDNMINKKRELVETLKVSKQKLISEIITKGLDKGVEMKDSEIEWIGNIPKSWDVKKMKFVTTLNNQKLKNNKFSKYIGLEHISQWSGELIAYGDVEELDSKVNSVFYKGNVLFGKLRPYLAKCIVADTEGVCSDEFLVLESDYIIPEFLKYLILSPLFIELVNSSTYGAKMPRASWDFIGNIKVAFPCKSEQVKIVDFINTKTSKINNIISKTEEQIELLKKARQKIITEVVTGKIDVRGY